jgi:AcrR family transcriptional regulator
VSIDSLCLLESNYDEPSMPLSTGTVSEMDEPPQKLTRREQYALTTKRAIVDAARSLFAERGYFATTVDDIAAEAEVAPATVYSSTGGKQGLLSEMIRLWQSDPLIKSTMDELQASSDPNVIIDQLSSATRQIREAWADVIAILLTTAPHDAGVATQLNIPTENYRAAIGEIAQRLAKLGALRDGVDVTQASDILWFYFGYSALSTLRDEIGWTYERAELWLANQAKRDLLAPS